MSKHIIELPYDIDVNNYMWAIVNKGTTHEKLVNNKITEISKDNKGWHIHFNGTRYNLDAIGRLIFYTKEEALKHMDNK